MNYHDRIYGPAEISVPVFWDLTQSDAVQRRVACCNMAPRCCSVSHALPQGKLLLLSEVDVAFARRRKQYLEARGGAWPMRVIS